MAVGWTRDGAVQDQIDATVDSAVQLARSQLPKGKSLKCCARCNTTIPEPRRTAIPGVRYCLKCQSELEQTPGNH
ncbi:MAG: DksA/TraR family C4-type zinc finger protein [Kiritimatiellae bacterium]|nr:DksA/TraR family C4-type zinc finger protein [Kiritimatiellia bacterium]MDD4340947.1 DksA/TraR family C4-type zinc finger protein [Kiritimatiellia bacterium]MDY0148652.1 DksA/TraR family C4-type zinc finger protein [Kiritimatiellia bacterium]